MEQWHVYNIIYNPPYKLIHIIRASIINECNWPHRRTLAALTNPDGWVQLRTSNTEPIMRIYAESTSMEKAQKYADAVKKIVLG